MKISHFVVVLLEDLGDTEKRIPEIPISQVSSRTLEKIIVYCSHYKTEPMKEIKIPLKSSLREVVGEWYANFVSVEQEDLFHLIRGADSLEIKPLLDLASSAVAVMMRGKTAEEIRHQFNISNDLTQEEEEQMRLQNARVENP